MYIKMYNTYPCSSCINAQRCYPGSMHNSYNNYQYPYYNSDFYRHNEEQDTPYADEMEYDPRLDATQDADPPIILKDYGPQPFVVNINEAAKQNNAFRTALWTGRHLQVTLMSINVGNDIGLEMHPNVDQFLRIEEGQGFVRMGKTRDRLDFQARVSDDFAIMVPAGTWHNITNTGNRPLKVYSIYAPPQHPHGTVHTTKPGGEAH